MKTLTLFTLLTLLLFTPQGALGAPAKRLLDDTSLSVFLTSRVHGDPEKSYYEFEVKAGLYGGGAALGKQDAVIVNWKKGAKVLASQRCSVDVDEGGKTGSFYCKHDKTKLSADGKLQVEILYVDDRAEQKELLKTLNIQVGRWYYWTGMNGRKPKHRIHYQVIGDDLLGTTYLFKSDGGSGLPRLELITWVSRDNDRNESNLKGVLRCTVNGKALPTDIDVTLKSHQSAIQVVNRAHLKAPPEGETLYQWKKMLLITQIYWGPTAVRKNYSNPNSMVFLSEHAGAWACKWRVDGTNLREFRFTVEPGDKIKPHAEQSGPNGLRLGKDLYFVETYFPTPVWDFVFNPAAIKATGAWGRPWANPAAMKAMLGALPKAKGTAVVKPAANAK
ncbi:MAG: hypothetical protein RBU30_20940 [Polyangia bacterium]|jgi:hypothetical protein|nr:hypothetical protein [Polyangia bacterium]